MQGHILGVLAGQDLPQNLLESWARRADVLVAADGAAHRLIGLGLRPVVVGDLDSLDRSDPGLADLVVVEDGDPYRTDCDKLLAWVAAQGGVQLDLVGVEGDRLDHTLSTLMSVLRSPLKVRLRTRTADAWIVRPGEHHSVGAHPGATVSLLPLEPSIGVSLRGVEWPLEQVELSPRGWLSISNRATASRVEASVDQGAALFYVERTLPEGSL
ncbi:MAG TPA: thiamine diphosphokinase [Fimbriimonadaceae bacterium]|nr:thiamine diphosphokinase [Fimbriimonadaceae bacterium]HRJ32501.1 thiamine diphosphokinase [Fimbriimonadaceae bacterium]